MTRISFMNSLSSSTQPPPVGRSGTEQRFCSQLAHEMNNPLGGLYLHIELLEEVLTSLPPDSAPGARASLAAMDDCVKRLQSLVIKLRSGSAEG